MWHGAGASRLAAPIVPRAPCREEEITSSISSSSPGVLALDKLLLGCSASWLAEGITWHSWKAANPSVQLGALGKCQEPQLCTAVGGEMRLAVSGSGALAGARCYHGTEEATAKAPKWS